MEGEYRCQRCKRVIRLPRGVTTPPTRSRCAPADVEAAKLAGPCIHLGEVVGQWACPTCRGNVRLKVYECLAGHGQITSQDCKTCGDYQAFGPSRTVYVHLPPHSYNGAIFEDQGRLRICWRQGWAGASLWLADLDDDYQPSNLVKLNISHSLCRAGREDPRVFRWNGRLHISFAGVQLVRGQTVVHQLVARLDESGTKVEAVWEPKYEARNSWEKNWGFFQDAASPEFYCVYTISPHVVLKYDSDPLTPYKMKLHSARTWQPKWSGGHLRGGAAPVRVGDEFYSFFHGALDHQGQRPFRTYSLGVYVFSAKPPFNPIRYTPDPIAWPPEPEGAQPNPDVRVVFPCGSVLRNDKWLVSAGINDQHISVLEFDAEALERNMRKA